MKCQNVAHVGTQRIEYCRGTLPPYQLSGSITHFHSIRLMFQIRSFRHDYHPCRTDGDSAANSPLDSHPLRHSFHTTSHVPCITFTCHLSNVTVASLSFESPRQNKYCLPSTIGCRSSAPCHLLQESAIHHHQHITKKITGKLPWQVCSSVRRPSQMCVDVA